MLKKQYFYLILSIILILGLYLLLNYEKNINIESYLKQKTQTNLQAYNVIYNEYKNLSSIVFQTKINTKEVIDILKKVKNATKSEKKSIRLQLYMQLKDTYELLKTYNIKRLHFHLPNNDSFLRFHKPSKFGDNLSNIRSTVRFVNKNKKAINGFEEGRIYNGYRYVFPLFDNKTHLGSVEISFSTLSMSSELLKKFNLRGRFLISKNIVGQEVFQEGKNNYVQSQFSDFLLEKKAINVLDSYHKQELAFIASEKTKEIVKQKAFTKNSFCVYDDSSDSIITFIKVFNPISKKVVGLMVLQSDANYIHNKTNNFYILLFLITLSILLLLKYIYKTANEKQILTDLVNGKTTILSKLNRELEKHELELELLNQNLEIKVQKRTQELQAANENLKQFIDTQDNIVILTNGKNLHFANKKFFEFFGFNTLEEFQSLHLSISELFIKNDRFFHLDKVKKNANWVTTMKTLYHSKRIVSMMGIDFKIHAFSVTINKFNNELYIVSFTNISQTVLEHIKLEEKSTLDKLTGAYNREYFEQNYSLLINKYHSSKYKFALAVLDIDHFKSVNDTYGHDVGDEVLIQFVKTIKQYSRKEDILIRWGGEEFILILKISSQIALEKALEHIRKVIEVEEFNNVGQKTCSIGGTLYQTNEPIEKTIKRADEAVYLAKNSGRNTVKVLL